MAIELRGVTPPEWDTLYGILVENDPFSKGLSLEDVRIMLTGHDEIIGIWDDQEDGGNTNGTGNSTRTLIGAILLNQYIPFHNIQMHIAVDAAYHGRWISRRLLQQFFGYLFGELGVQRVTAIAVPFMTYPAAKLLTGLGFIVEGVKRCGGRLPNGVFFDVVEYGMLAEECRWLNPYPTRTRKSLSASTPSMSNGTTG